ncbi:MAG: hypothetical protein K0Q59_3266 [Paenibacillus sp.]|nr:hypothetical protein [Paenibacillus sp.]
MTSHSIFVTLCLRFHFVCRNPAYKVIKVRFQVIMIAYPGRRSKLPWERNELRITMEE